jgi:uncharacterized repeat protein (TIGR03803 family)
MTTAKIAMRSAPSVHRSRLLSGRILASCRCRSPLAVAVAASVLGGGSALAADIYDPTSGQLTIPTLQLGTTTYSNIVVKVGALVSGPTGSSGYSGADSYSPVLNELTVPSVTVGSTPYFNVVVKVAGLVSIDGVAGADTYSGGALSVPTIQVLGGDVYTGVAATVGRIDGVGGGMPTVAVDSYNPATHQVTIPAIASGGRVYTNVAFTPGAVRGVGATQKPDTLVYSFDEPVNGSFPVGLIQGTDGSGNFYGNTAGGGASGAGTVFMVTPGGSQTVLHSFGAGADATGPAAPLIQASDGNLYGATSSGGAYGGGAIYKVTTSGTESIVHSFSGCAFGTCGVAGSDDGNSPGFIIQASDGNFYGTTAFGGTYRQGAVFRITPSGTESVLYSFAGCSSSNCGIAGSTDGVYPYTLLQGSDGNIYGTTLGGGAYPNTIGGTVFQLTLAGEEKTLYSFSGCFAGACGIAGSTDGASPAVGLVQDAAGNLYGVLSGGGAYGQGAIFKLTPAGQESVLYSFSGGGGMPGSADGGDPYGLVLGNDGNLYGAALAGGAYNQGAVYSLTTTGVETILHSFSGGGVLAGSTDGTTPDDLCAGSDGNLYGTTGAGGAGGSGAVFRITIAAPAP